MITTGKDPAPQYRPFIVETAQGTVRALGTRFTVRQQAALTQVAVLQHAVEIMPTRSGRGIRLNAGQSAAFNTAGMLGQVQTLDAAAALWEKGLLLAQDLPLADLLAELGRYRRGIVRCHPALAQLRVSGAFSVLDTDATLRLLEQTLPLRVSTMTRYWVSVEPT